MKKTTAWELAAFGLGLFVLFSWIKGPHENKSPSETIAELSTKLERERSFNARRARRLHYTMRPESINLESVALANHLTGIKPSAAASILYTENGPEFIESGSLDKTDFFTQFPIERRSAVEGSKTLNRMAWNYLTNHPAQLRAMLKESAYRYTNMGPNQQAAWVENFLVAESKFSVNISWANKGETEPITLTRPTPTPVYESANSSQKKGKTPKGRKRI